ncbi:MAG: redoxin domain-containing protein [Bacteroidales bacterium]|nr:redoxin domain-containing protein [Bacteroidales bacterium]
MRKIILFVIIIASLFSTKILFSQGYKIKVQLQNTPDSIMYLVNYNGDKQYIKDTVPNHGNGVFVFEGEKKLPQGIYLAVRQDKNYFEFLVPEDQKFSLTTSYDNMVEEMKVKGSEENSHFYDFLHYSSPKNQKVVELQKEIEGLSVNDSIKKEQLQNKVDSLNKLITSYKQNYIKNNPESFMAQIYQASRDPEVPDAPEDLNEEEKKEWQYNYFVNHYFDNLDLSSEVMLHTPVLHQRISNFINNVVIQDPDSIIRAADRIMNMAKDNEKVTRYLTWYLTYNAEQSDIMGMDKVFVHMADNYFGKEKTPWVSKKVLKNIKKRADKLRNILIGKKAPNMLLTDTSGNPVALHSVESKYLVLYFWEPDCGHCKRQTPKLKRLYEDVKDKGVKVYAACIDRKNPGKWKKYIKKNNLEWINVYDGKQWTSFHNLYDLIATPTIFLLDEDKKILAKRINPNQLRKFLEREMEEDKNE